MSSKPLSILVSELKTVLNTLNSPWDKVDKVNDFLEEARAWKPEISLKFIDEAIEQANTVGYSRGIFFLLCHKVYILAINSDIKNAEITFEKSRGLFAGAKVWPLETAYYFYSQGMLEMNIGLPGASLRSYRKAMKLAEDQKCLKLIESCYNSIGLRHLNAQRYKEAEETFLKGLEVLSPDDFPYGYICICNNLGSLYCKMDLPKKAIPLLESGIKIATEIDHRPFLSSLAQEMALVYEFLNNNSLAMKWYKKSLLYIDGVHHLTIQTLIDYGRFLLKNTASENEGLQILKDVKISMKDNRDNTNLLNANRILLEYYEKQSLEKEALKIYRELLILEKDQLELQNKAHIRRIERETSVEWNERLQKLIDAGRMILNPVTIDDIFNIFLECAPFIKNSEIVFLAEKETDSSEIQIYPYLHYNEFRRVDPLKDDDPNSFVAYSMRKSRLISIQDLEKQSQLFLKNTKTLEAGEDKSKIQSLICIPFNRAEKKCVLSVQSEKVNFYSKHDIDYLRGLCFFFGIALDSADKNRKISILSTRDSLTNLYNRREFFRLAELHWSAHSRSSSPLCIAILDIDHFKSVNDCFGHSAGDDCLTAMSGVLRTKLKRKTDIYARYGGEEFIILFGYGQISNTASILENLREEIASLVVIHDNDKISFTVSIGLTMGVPGGSKILDEMIEEADKALYKAKESGRNKLMISKIPPREKLSNSS